ncbi:hypothetical protein PF005_g12644 [Phytophthora fragariae]|uniref:RxLR effector protein n=2 Tax=Phytophthora TaxID=4783 RepID=A0A6A3T9G1_9STRA|nr:hypothetical protein PF003_g31199 [Phytophthora fragariae]KAE9013050.1 hypothetical protein PR002_g14629 [Phytophthora rubi]KAE8934871.1 hypothetical protein PF009_g15157 [Phytophthora fragariae]KAE8997449.1 hypothetical protein PF011_g15487 [Phytophthora fragariae]KAE9014870.1 hypothetical protein PR001_g15033 [Phytophthora rubi]
MKTQKLCFSIFVALSAVHIMRCANTNDLHVLHGNAMMAYHEMPMQVSTEVKLASCV